MVKKNDSIQAVVKNQIKAFVCERSNQKHIALIQKEHKKLIGV